MPDVEKMRAGALPNRELWAFDIELGPVDDGPERAVPSVPLAGKDIRLAMAVWGYNRTSPLWTPRSASISAAKDDPSDI